MLSAVDFFKINNVQTHDVRYFAMLNNAVAVSGDSKLEGGTVSLALAYYNYLLNIELPNCPLSLKLTNNEQQERAVKKRMANLERMNTDIEKTITTSSPGYGISYAVYDLVKYIPKYCKEEGACYLPSGYMNLKKGHFAGLKVRKLEDGRYAFSCINHGEGIQYHRKSSISGGKTKYSYQSDEYLIDINSTEGNDFLKKIIELRFDSQKKEGTEQQTNPYSSEDLYGLLKLHGEELPLEEIKEKSVTPQRSGTCPVTNTHAMARDSLIDNNADFNTRKRYHFVIKLRSLIAAFAEYRKPNNKYTIPIMEWALKEFSVRLNKQYRTILSDDEVIYCGQLQAQIKDRLNEDKKAAIKLKCKSKPYPSFTGDAPKSNESIFGGSKSTILVNNEL